VPGRTNELDSHRAITIMTRLLSRFTS
jgi:hypothetical protein